jgi:hypothetical protein
MMLLPVEGALVVIVGVLLLALVFGFALKRIDMSL